MIVLLRVLEVLKWLVIVDAVLSWISPPDRFPRSVTQLLLGPVYRPIHEALGARGPVDFAPLILLAVVFGAQLLVRKAAYGDRR